MADKPSKVIIRGYNVDDDDHGKPSGAWKLAYADFVTAMMAFFLLMWLLSSPKPSDVAGIADYFTKNIKTASVGGNSPGAIESIVTSKGGGSTKAQTGAEHPVTDGSEKLVELASSILSKDKESVDKAALENLKQKIQEKIDSDPKMNAYKDQIILENSIEGLQIQLVDSKNRPMFDAGKSKMKDYSVEILKNITALLNTVDNKIAVSGHTDSTPYSMGDTSYGNWELSVDRATSSRREMVRAGMPEDKIIRVNGMGSSIPLASDSKDPSNRRIEILVMSKGAEIDLLKTALAARINTNKKDAAKNDSKR